MRILFKKVMIACWLICTQVILSQSVDKIMLTPEDYDKWSTLTYEKISPNGKWISYKLGYSKGLDTLFLKHTETSNQYSFPKGNNAVFSDNNQWLTVNELNGVVLQNLKTGVQTKIVDALQADFMMEGNRLVIFLKNKDDQALHIMDLKNGTSHKINEVKEYRISPDKKSLGYITQSNTVEVVWKEAINRFKTLIESSPNERKNLVWNDSGNAISFLEELSGKDSLVKNHKIFLIKEVKGKEQIFMLDPEKAESGVAGKTIIYRPPFTPLLIAPDDKKIFFYINGEVQKVTPGKKVEVWNSLDKLEYNRNILEGNPQSRPKLLAWWPESDKTLEITNNRHPSVYLTPDKNKAIVFDPHQYEPQKDIVGPADLWIKDINTGKDKFILEKQSGYVSSLGVSPNSRYLNYYRDKHWWVYDMYSDKHLKITDSLFNFEDAEYSHGGDPPSYGFAGWSEDSKYLLLYSHYDVWLISADGKRKERITNGKVDGIRYRVVNNLTGNPYYIPFKLYDIVGFNVDLKEGIVMEAFDLKSKASGYYHWKADKLSEVLYKDAKLNRIQKASQTDHFILLEQKADVSPQIVLLEDRTKEKVLVKTNSHQEKYKWTKSELISYTNSNGDSLQGILQYPAGYEIEKKYPLLVYIYERQSQYLHEYQNPTYYDQIGNIPTNFTTDGYLVLYPDISYELGKIGYSAVDCVEAAVKEVLKKGIVEDDRIGLIGHSFGGYEVAFIITQSNMFAAAVAGAGYTDFVSHSLSIDTAGRSQMWRYQSYQLRMGKSLYEDYSGFMENSPITYAPNITTPLLSWTGDKDYQVDPQQSYALHMAMRNLKKRHILLVYPGEMHTVVRPDFQKDLNIKIKNWFDHYLKDKPLSNDLK